MDKNFWRNPTEDRLNYNDYRESFNLFLEDYNPEQASDELKREVKMYNRFAAYWDSRTATDDINTAGLFTNYYQSILDWQDEEVCVESMNNPEPWEAMGPSNYATHNLGRVDCAWIHPNNHNVIFAGTAYGGLFKTVNGGESWYNVTDELYTPGIGCTYIAVDPNNLSIMYMGLGLGDFEYGTPTYGPGIVKSTDGGESWAVLEGFEVDIKTRVHKVLVDPTNSNIIWATAHNYFRKSINGGVTWSEDIIPFDNNNSLVEMTDHVQQFIDFEFDPENSDIIYATSQAENGRGLGAQLWITEDGGTTWNRLDQDMEKVYYNFNDGLSSYESPWNYNSSSQQTIDGVPGSGSSLSLNTELALDVAYALTAEVNIPHNCKLVFEIINDNGTIEEIYTHEFSSNNFSGIINEDLTMTFVADDYDPILRMTAYSQNGYLVSDAIIVNNLSIWGTTSAILEVEVPQGGKPYVAVNNPLENITRVYKYNSNLDEWEYIAKSNNGEFSSSQSAVGISRLRHGFEVSVVGFGSILDEFFIAGNKMSHYTGGGVFSAMSNYYYLPNASQPNTHADVRFISLENGVLLVGNDGGLTVSFDGGQTWESKNGNDLQTSLIYDLGTSELMPERYVIGCQDNSTFHNFSGNWHLILETADGGGSEINPFDPNVFYTTKNSSRKLRVYNPNTESSSVSSVNFTGGNNGTVYKLPIVADPNLENVVYYGMHTKGLHKVTGTSESIILADHDVLGIKGSIMDIAVGESDPDYLYFISSGIRWNSVGNLDDKQTIFRSTDGGSSWTDISGDIVAPKSFGGRGILVNPENENMIWACFGGLPSGNGTYNKRVYMSVSGGDSWMDWSKGLPLLPVNSLAYQKTANYIYAGTDVGVYFRHRDDPVDGIGWQCFNDGLPVCIITDVDVINCSQELVVSTFGRGVWRTALIPAPDLVISSDET